MTPFPPYVYICKEYHSVCGTPTKRQVSKSLVSKRLKRQVYKTSALQNVRFTKRQVFKTSGCKKTSIHFLYLCWLQHNAGYVAAMFAGKVTAVFYFLFLSFFVMYHHNG
jgi:hypothetical protein